jgi:hypothetical protein
VVVNNLVGAAYHRRGVHQSDGTGVEAAGARQDISRAFLAARGAAEIVHNQAFNVGNTQRTIKFVTSPTSSAKPSWAVQCDAGGGPDPRCYRVNCDKISAMPGFR